MIFELKPINNRFKNLISKFGKLWFIVQGPFPMHCFNGQLGVTCKPVNHNEKLSNFKWNDVQ